VSGIVGIYNFDRRPVTPGELGAAVDMISHRGPDGVKLWHQDQVGLGQAMLLTTPESCHEMLPYWDADTNLAITADARLDNRDDLIQRLRLQSLPDRQLTDSYLILRAYRQWGEHCLERLLGDFAFAIWDQTNQVMFCGRDHMGVKPFVYHHSRQSFIFASEVKGVLAWPQVPRNLDEMRIAQHLCVVAEEKVRTFYQAVVRLPAAHGLLIYPDGQRQWCYWQPDTKTELRLGSDEAYAEAFHDLFTATVHCRMRSAYRVGSMLSGGLDSSSIACIGRNYLAQTGSKELFPTFSAVFPSLAKDYPEIDERPYIKAVIDSGGFEPHNIYADQFSPLESRAQADWHIDGPSLAFNLYMDWIIFKAAQEQGVRVLFSGQDGDSTVGYGHEYLTHLARRGRWLKMHQEAKQLAKVFYNSRVSAQFLMWQYGFRYLIPPAVWQLRDALRPKGKKTRGLAASRLINPAFAKRLGLDDYLHDLDCHKKRACSIREEHASHLVDGVMEYTLETLDQLASAFSVQMRYPFCDKRLIEFCVSVPPGQRLQQGWTRSIQRRGMDSVLPKEVRWRPDKGNLSANFKQKMAQEQTFLDDAILNQGHLVEDYVNLSVLQKAYRQHGAQMMMHEGDAIKSFPIITLSRWLATTQAQPALVR
jgi:asparagine synthase (glutamine-hydrolysing)